MELGIVRCCICGDEHHYEQASFHECRSNSPEKECSVEEKALAIVDKWKSYWANQRQNSQQDYDNYFHRAMGVDANMRHHLASLIAEGAKSRDAEVERLKEDKAKQVVTHVYDLDKQIQSLTEENARLSNELSLRSEQIDVMAEHQRNLTALLREYEGALDNAKKDFDDLDVTLMCDYKIVMSGFSRAKLDVQKAINKIRASNLHDTMGDKKDENA